MSARHGHIGFCIVSVLVSSTPTWAAAACTPDPGVSVAKNWCFAFGGTLDADVRQSGAGDEINRVTRVAEGPVASRARHDLAVAIHYDSFELDETVAANLDLYRIELRFRLELGEAATLHLAPALATSSNRIFEDMARDDFLAQAALTYRWRQPGIVTGIAHDARLGGGLRTYPLVRMPLSAGNRVQGSIGFPDASLRYRGRQRDWTLRLGPGGYSWHVLDDDGNFRFDVRLRRWELGLTVARRQRPRFFLDAGIAFARQIEFTTSATQRVETRLDSALFATVGLRLGTADTGSHRRRH